MTAPAGVPAVGGTRLVPAPDPIAAEYILLALRLDQHRPGIVDAYVGPADLKARVETEQLVPPARLRDAAAALRERVAREVEAADRAAWLTAQLRAIETLAAELAGAELPYRDLVAACFDHPIRWWDEAIFAAVAAELEALVPGDGPLADRLAAWDAALTVDEERVEPLARWLAERFREQAATLVGLPEGESLRIGTVRGQPWSGYTWYDGGRRSRVDLNLDLPIRVPELAAVVAHETYPGHHLEHAWKEAELVDRLARLEASLLSIDTPECLLSEGLADLGRDLVVPPAHEPDLLAEAFVVAGLPLAADPVRRRETAERAAAIGRLRRRLGAAAINAALLRHAEGRSAEEVVAYLREVGKLSPERAAKRLEFIDHPLWRPYVFVYAEGEALLRRWLELVPEGERAARFGRLLREQHTPSGIRAEIEAAGAGPGAEPGTPAADPTASSRTPAAGPPVEPVPPSLRPGG